MIVTVVKVGQNAIKDSIKRSIRVLGGKCNLNFIDTELINDMSFMFYGCPLESNKKFQPKFNKK